MIWGVLIVAVAALVVVALVAWPLVRAEAEATPPDPEADVRRDVDERLGMSLEAIREIEMDHRAGNLSDEDFAELDAAERARAVELMRQADALRQGDDAPESQRDNVPEPPESQTDRGPEATREG
ncbi:MAG TPA: hypothetical protein VFG74_12465 [Miltoncostaeaceae bacterium]|jgi:hypothetical protein|nr:hypothetical protein [Miltoncostaeaceae bacterium]